MMVRPRHAAAVLACALLAVQPCVAAEDRRDLAAPPARGAAFAGASLRLPLGGPAGQAPSGRLQFSPHYLTGDGVHGGSGLELGLSGNRKPTLFIGGQSSAEIERRLSLGGSSTTYILIGGAVILTVIVLASVADAMPTPGPDEDAF